MLKEELMWAIGPRRKADKKKKRQGWRAEKDCGYGVGSSNCKPAQGCMDTHHALVKTWLPVILLRRSSAAVCRSWCLHSDRPLVDSRSVCNNCSNYSEKRWRTAGETAEWRDLARASLTIIASLLPFIFLVLARRLWTKTCSYALFSLHCGSSSAIH